ncbi:hypothetical protein FSP39_023166 [Pinctada imbricata]|uniref:Phosphatidylinositol transfer protein N-terminal domain-containing protein n=1 Tax=Pinctada imbricata TaxID=66713 RepID=A0AA88XPF5_PINIB|nr:hypothetical protein FSP39_023166 [Pinctada imbricata]
MGGKYTTGQYTHKIYHLASRVPGFIRLVAPKGSLEIHEKAWNAYPYCRTIVTNPDYMKEGFFIKIETLHVADNGESENVHNLNSEDLGIRKIERIDIANDSVRSSDYKEEWDPSKVKSEKTGRGPLTGADWNKRVDPVMCCYKLVSVKFKWFGLQNRVEKFIQQQERRIFLNFHRQLVCWMDKWYGLSMQDIREIEDRTKRELDEARATGEVRGTKAEEEKETKGAKK